MATSFLSDLLAEYGRAGDRFAGHGKLTGKHGSAGMAWAAAQYPDGQGMGQPP